MVTKEQYETLLSLAMRTIHAAQLEQDVQMLQQHYPQAFALSKRFYCATYRTACDSVMINIHKLYHKTAKSLTLHSIIEDVKDDTDARYERTKQMRDFIKQHQKDIEDIRLLRNGCVAHLSISPQTLPAPYKTTVMELAQEAYSYIKDTALLHHGYGYGECPHCHDIHKTAYIVEEVQNGKT